MPNNPSMTHAGLCVGVLMAFFLCWSLPCLVSAGQAAWVDETESQAETSVATRTDRDMEQAVREAHAARVRDCRLKTEGDGSTFEDRLALARAMHLQAVDGERQVAKPSRQMLETLLEEDPGDAVVRAYLGSAWLLESKLAFLPGTKGKLAIKGLTLLDGAVAAAADDVEVRIVRAIACGHLPDFFERQGQVAADLAWVEERLEGALAAADISGAVAAGAFLHIGDAMHEAGEFTLANEAWARARHLAGDSPSGIKAAGRLGEGDGDGVEEITGVK